MRKIAPALILLATLAVPPIGSATIAPPGGGPDGGPLLGPIPAAAPNGHLFDWNGVSNGVAADKRYAGDELIVTDYVFDDTGADTDGGDGRSENATELYSLLEGANAAIGQAGDFAYPADAAFAGNSADIVETRIALGDDAWYVLVQLNTLIEPERVAFDATFQDPNLDGPPNRMLVHGETGVLDGEPVNVVADPLQNTIEVEVPFSVLDPADREFDVFLGAGLWDEAADDWLLPAEDRPAYFDLAWVEREPEDSYWNDKLQSQSLARGTHDQNTFRVFFDALVCADCSIGVPPPTIPCCPRHTAVRVFRSGQELGEGVQPETLHDQQEGGFGYRSYRSPYQPYSLYVPDGLRLDRPRPLVLLLHFLGGNYMSYPITSLDGMRDWADNLGVIVAMPHGRGEAGWYEGPAEKDVFEVWRDVARYYPIDRERVYLAGMSMGGFGTWRLGSLYPDQFAAGLVWSGPVTPYSIWPYPVPVTYPRENPPMCARDDAACGYNLMDLMGNLGNVPMHVVHGGLDELVPSPGAEHWMEHFGQVGGSYTYVFYPTRRHETSYPGSSAHWVKQWLDDLPARERAPTHVDYTIVRDLFQPEHGIVYDRAYFARDLHLAPGAAQGRIAAGSGPQFKPRQSCMFVIVVCVEDPLEEVSPCPDEGVCFAGGIDHLGPFRVTGREAPRDEPDSFIGVSIQGLDAGALLAPGLHWPSDEERAVYVATDTDTVLELRGGFPADTSVTVEEGEATVGIQDGSILLSIAAPGASFSIDPTG